MDLQGSGILTKYMESGCIQPTDHIADGLGKTSCPGYVPQTHVIPLKNML